MKRQQPRRRNARKLIIWACLSIGIFASGCSGRNQRGDNLPTQGDAAKCSRSRWKTCTSPSGKTPKMATKTSKPTMRRRCFVKRTRCLKPTSLPTLRKSTKNWWSSFSDSPFAPPALFNAALSLEALGRYGEASDRYKQVVALFPSSKNAKDAALRQALFAEVGKKRQRSDAFRETSRTEAHPGRLQFLSRCRSFTWPTLPISDSATCRCCVCHKNSWRLISTANPPDVFWRNTKYVETIKLKNPTRATAAGFTSGRCIGNSTTQ